MQKEMRDTLQMLALVGSMYAAPIAIVETIKDSRVFTIDGKEVWISQSRKHEGNMEMYMGSGFSGHRWFDLDNDWKLDIARTEVATPRRYHLSDKKITGDDQSIYEKAREEYIAGKGEVRIFRGMYKSVKDFLSINRKEN